MKHKKLRKTLKIVLIILLSFCVVLSVGQMIAYKALFKHYEIQENPYSFSLNSYCQLDENVYPRQLISYSSDKETLQGYYYPKENSDGLIVFTHGYKACANGYLGLITSMLDNNYSVFAYDCSGANQSTGKTTYGLNQALIDLDYTLRFIKSSDSIEHNDIYLMGHSLGGYASCSVLSIHDGIKGVVSIAGLNDAYNLFYDEAAMYVGKAIASLMKPIVNVYERHLFGDYCDYTAVMGLNKYNTPALIAQGYQDTTIVYDKMAITAYANEITNPNVTYYFADGKRSEHTVILLSDAAIEYQRQVKEQFSQIQKEYKQTKDNTKAIEFIENVDHHLYSQFNQDLLEKIITFFHNN